uniref:C-type lectin domain-containing protein n=1 Tax=Callorhinchus milii TaxID=7868 RepID=A0A4W3I466_CALMI
MRMSTCTIHSMVSVTCKSILLSLRCRKGETMGRARGSGIELDSSFQKADWIGSKYSCYWIRKEHMKWKEALHFCESAATGAHLLDINTEEEHMLISSHLRSLNNYNMLWTGLNDIETRPPVLLYAVNIRSNLPRRPVQDRISSKGLCELELEMNSI